MHFQRLRHWLELPEGPWPPDHYTLLGLAPGEGESEAVEQRALDRMERLRRYQLPFPDEVTEGMNRLAQALDCLCDPEQRRRYDADLGLRSEPASVLPDIELPDVLDLADDLDAPEVLQNGPAPIAVEVPAPPASGQLADLEPIPLEPEEPPRRRQDDTDSLPAVILLPERPRRRQRVEPETPAPERPDIDPTRAARRQRYAELVRLRKVLRVWQEVSDLLNDPERTLQHRSELTALAGALSALRPVLPLAAGLVGGVNQPGYLVATMTRQPQVTDTLRSLLPSQRDALAQDCRAAHFLLDQRSQRLRHEVRLMSGKGWVRRHCGPFLRRLARNPEWPLLILGVCALLIALLRSIPG